MVLAGPEKARSALSGAQGLPQPLGSPSWRQLVCAVCPRASAKAETRSGSTYALARWFVLLGRRYGKEKFLVVHLKTGNSEIGWSPYLVHYLYMPLYCRLLRDLVPRAFPSPSPCWDSQPCPLGPRQEFGNPCGSVVHFGG